ncbi:MAG: hypothetical protein WBG90_00615 [Saonia sp.]
MLKAFGNEPSGFSWTGFVSYIKYKPSFLLLFREHTESDYFKTELLRLESQSLLKPILGNGISVEKITKEENKIKIKSKSSFSYGIFAID